MKIDELRESIAQDVVERERLINVSEIEWWEDTVDDIKVCGDKIGISIDKVYFSGFNNQGDGACFEGFYEYRKQSVSLIFGHAPKDEELMKIARNLQELQRFYFYQLSARVFHRGHYYHENCTVIDVAGNEDFAYEVHDDAEDGVTEFLRDFMRWSYKRLEQECNFLTSDEQVMETLRLNEYEFDQEGNEL